MSKSSTESECFFQSKRDGFIPFEFLIDFLDFLDRNRDLVEVLTYKDLEWEDDWDYSRHYPDEWERWRKSLRNGGRDPNKIYLFIQHDVDSNPERSINAIQAERRRGIRSNVMIFNRLVDRSRLAQTGEVALKEYNLDYAVLKAAEAEGFVVGFHCNALERAAFDIDAAIPIMESDYKELRSHFSIDFYSPHGGVRGPDGRSNFALEIPASLSNKLRWVHNRHSIRLDGNYSDGGLNGKMRDVSSRDPREFVKTWRRGKRYRILFHPQYFHTPYSESRRLLEAPWYRELIGSYGRSACRPNTWPDDLLKNARTGAGAMGTSIVGKKLSHTLTKIASRFAGVAVRPVRERSFGPPIIIGGDGRSGTTLLSVILDSHPKLAVGAELHFNGAKLPNLGPYIFECFDKRGRLGRIVGVDDVLKPGIQFINRCNRSGIPPDVLRQLIFECQRELKSDLSTFADRCDLVRRLGEYNCHQKSGAYRWGFKIMREITNVAKFAAVWPHACFLHIIRDGRDVASSQIKEHGSWGYASIEEAAAGWVKVIEGARATSLGLKYREIRYEDLVEDPETVLRQLMIWLGENWDDTLLSHHSVKHAVLGSRVRHPSRDQVAQPINQIAVSRYVRDLTPEQIRAFESVAGHLLDDLEYPRHNSLAEGC